MAKQFNNFIVDKDPSMERSLKIKRKIENDLKPYQELFGELKRQKRQLPITMYFSKKQPMHSTDSERPSTSIATAEVSLPTLDTNISIDVPPSPTQSDPDDPSIPFRL